MDYQEWLQSVPLAITGDVLWKMEVYRLALFAADVGWIVGGRLELLTKVIRLLLVIVSRQRSYSVKEDEEEYRSSAMYATRTT